MTGPTVPGGSSLPPGDPPNTPTVPGPGWLRSWGGRLVGASLAGELPPGTVVTVGVFDGAHRGHQELLGRTVAAARARGLLAGAVTFDRPPVEVLRPGVRTPRLATLSERVGLLCEQGLDFVVVLRFTPALSRVTAEEFAGKLLFGDLGAREVLVGANFRFGHRAAGTPATLAEAGRAGGAEVTVVGLRAEGGEPLSSTRAREALARGDVAAAARMLGRPYGVGGEVVEGHRRGRLLGVPTANLAVRSRLALPATGVYAGHLEVPGVGVLKAVSNVGTSPQFGGTELRVEAHALDFEGDLYGRRVRLTFEHRLRGEATFPTVEDLVEQMRADAEQARHLLG